MAYEAERLINRKFRRRRDGWWIKFVSHTVAALLGVGATLIVVLLIRKI